LCNKQRKSHPKRAAFSLLIFVLLHVYKAMVSGKKFTAHESPTARKSRYIKGFPVSRG